MKRVTIKPRNRLHITSNMSPQGFRKSSILTSGNVAAFEKDSLLRQREAFARFRKNIEKMQAQLGRALVAGNERKVQKLALMLAKDMWKLSLDADLLSKYGIMTSEPNKPDYPDKVKSVWSGSRLKNSVQ